MKYSENNKPIICMMTQSTCYKGTRPMTPVGVLWHSTGANNPWLKRYVQPDDDAPNREEMIALIGQNQYNNDWNHIYRKAGLNAWIGKLADGTIASIQVMPWDFRPWGCGSGPKGSCNNGWMQFEICEDSLNDKAYFEAVYKEACELTAYYCKMYNLDPHGTVNYNGLKVPVILDHKTSHDLGLGENHGDVQHWFKKYGKTLDDVRDNVAALLSEDAPAKPTPAPTPTPEPKPTKELYRVRKSWEDAKSQIGAYNILDNAKRECDKAGPEYHVYDSKGNAIYPEEKTQPKPDASKVDTSAADPKVIWDFLVSEGLTEYGAAGLMGNLYAESALRPTNLQNGYEKSLGMTDAEYTAAVDAGTYTNFVKDSAGYGLAQWTYWSRKQAMLSYHKAAGKSIGDLKTQLNFLIQELKEYKDVWSILTSATTVVDASNSVLLDFERPAEHGLSVQVERANYGQKYYDQFASKKPTPEVQKPTQNTQSKPTLRKGSNGDEVRLLQTELKRLGFDCKGIDGIYGANTQNAVIGLQRERSLSPDGICGPLTWAEIYAFAQYKVAVTASALNIRSGPSMSGSVKGILHKNATQTIVYEKNGWGKLINGAGWIALNYTSKI